jgi:PAS domain S-box-containing protein
MADPFLSPLLMQIVEKLKSAVVVTLANLEAPGPTIVYANRAFLDQTGYALEELVGSNPRMLQGPRTDEATLLRLRRALERGEEFDGETWNYRKDGSAYRVRWYIRPLVDETEAISHFFAVQEDVSLQVALVHDLLRRPELSFDGLALSSFVQLVEMEKRTCRLAIERNGERGRLYFDRGRVVGATLGERSGIEAALELLSWDRVDLELGPLVETPSPVIDEPLQFLLLESARLRDEGGRGEG